jgi:hypothetical protein
MKTFLFIFLTIFLTKTCGQKKDTTVSKIVPTENLSTKLVMPEDNRNAKAKTQNNNPIAEYEALSRGFFLKIIYSENKILYTQNRDSTNNLKTINLSAVETEDLNKLMDEINIQKLETFKAPTEKRIFDGAPHANLSINYNGETYRGQGFDHGQPPVEIEKFVNKLTSYIKK